MPPTHVPHTLLREADEPLARLSLWHIQVFLPDPPKQPHSLREHGVALEVVRRDGLGRHQLRGECAAVRKAHHRHQLTSCTAGS
jgi:hypothetical protein